MQYSHLVRCSRRWREDLHDHDNAIRCLVEAECRASLTAICSLSRNSASQYFGTISLAERCFRKAVTLATSENDLLRLQEFFETFAPDMAERCRPALLEFQQKISTDIARRELK